MGQGCCDLVWKAFLFLVLLCWSWYFSWLLHSLACMRLLTRHLMSFRVKLLLRSSFICSSFIRSFFICSFLQLFVRQPFQNSPFFPSAALFFSCSSFIQTSFQFSPFSHFPFIRSFFELFFLYQFFLQHILILPLHLQLKTVSKWMSLYKLPLYDLFWPLFWYMYVHLSQNWGSDGYFEVLNGSKSW